MLAYENAYATINLLEGVIIVRLFAKFGTVLLVAITFLCIAPEMSSATEYRPICYGQSCDGFDPAKTRCVDDAITLMSRHATTPLTKEDLGILELRYSSVCHSNWVRFTPWPDLQYWIGSLVGIAQPDGTPWIWRLGVGGSLRGEINQSPVSFAGDSTHWTSMVIADGVTCSSVGLYETAQSNSGQGDRRSLGSYNAPCIS